jgi:hypothetical protein
VCRAWLADVIARCKAAVAVAEDQTRPPGKRDLGRASARSLLAEAEGALQAQLRCARAGLAVGEGWLRVHVTDDTTTLPGRCRIGYTEPSGARVYPYVPVTDIDGDRVRCVFHSESADTVVVLIASDMPIPGGVAVTARRADVSSATPEREEPPLW